jgi:hypothetical protein
LKILIVPCLYLARCRAGKAAILRGTAVKVPATSLKLSLVIVAAFARTNDDRLFAVVVSLEDRKETSAITAIGVYGGFDQFRSRDRARFIRLAYAPIARTDDHRFVDFAVLNEA